MHLKEARALAETTIRSDLIRGSIDAMLLRVLSAHDSYGYEIIKTITQRTGGRGAAARRGGAVARGAGHH